MSTHSLSVPIKAKSRMIRVYGQSQLVFITVISTFKTTCAQKEDKKKYMNFELHVTAGRTYPLHITESDEIDFETTLMNDSHSVPIASSNEGMINHTIFRAPGEEESGREFFRLYRELLYEEKKDPHQSAKNWIDLVMYLDRNKLIELDTLENAVNSCGNPQLYSVYSVMYGKN